MLAEDQRRSMHKKGGEMMEFKFSDYKNHPNKLIMAKIEKLVKLENAKLKPNFEKVKTPSQLFNELERPGKRKEYLETSLFIDVISFDMAKEISTKTRLTKLQLFKMIRFSIPIEIANELMKKYTIPTKEGILFVLREPFRTKLMEYYIKQISEGKTKLEFPKEFYKKE
jgi:hypothetical protein